MSRSTSWVIIIIIIIVITILAQSRTHGGVDSFLGESAGRQHFGQRVWTKSCVWCNWNQRRFFFLELCVHFHKVPRIQRCSLHSEPPFTWKWRAGTLFYPTICWRQQRPVIDFWIIQQLVEKKQQPTSHNAVTTHYYFILHLPLSPSSERSLPCIRPIMQSDSGLNVVWKEDPRSSAGYVSYSLCSPSRLIIHVNH